MERIDRMEALSPLLTAQLCRGVRTNNTMSPQDYRREIGRGALYAQPLEAGLLLLRRREGHWLVNYYLPPEARPFSLPVDGLVTVELPFRPKDAAMERELLALFQASGFSQRLRRVRLERPAGDASAPEGEFAVRPGRGEDFHAAMALLREGFDPLTGCLPGEDDLSEDIAGGNLICAWDGEGQLAGLLHGSRAKASAEIRHLVVRPGLRGRGCAQSLMAAWLASVEGCRTRVWTGADNEAALRTYRRAGYEKDGWYSVVMAAGGNGS